MWECLDRCIPRRLKTVKVCKHTLVRIMTYRVALSELRASRAAGCGVAVRVRMAHALPAPTVRNVKKSDAALLVCAVASHVRLDTAMHQSVFPTRWRWCLLRDV